MPVAISEDPVAIDSELERTAPTIVRNDCTIAPIDCINWPISSRVSERMSCVRSPAAMACASACALRTGLTTDRVSTTANQSPATSARAQPTPSAITPCAAAASAAALVAFMRLSWYWTRPLTAA